MSNLKFLQRKTLHSYINEFAPIKRKVQLIEEL
jgi:hypothetical protein